MTLEINCPEYESPNNYPGDWDIINMKEVNDLQINHIKTIIDQILQSEEAPIISDINITMTYKNIEIIVYKKHKKNIFSTIRYMFSPKS